MTALEAQRPDVDPGEERPRIYLACPLTGLTSGVQRQIESDIALVRQAIERETDLDRIDAERWPVALYAPIAFSAPWKGDGLAPAEVYRQNLDAVHDADALIVLAEKGGSAGVGQELEWGSRLGIPIAYLTASNVVSRQIAGTPALIAAHSYNKDPETLESKVRNFLRRWKPVILDGPRRRASRALRFEPITLRLRGAWQSCSDPTGVAAQIRVDVQYLELVLSDPRYVAMMPTETLLSLAHALDVPLSGLERPRVLMLPVAAMRALMAAAAEDGWSDSRVEQLVYKGRAAMESSAAYDLLTISGWRAFNQEA